jgi:molybdenum cofactor synthesis domain-containing protein
MSDAPPIELFSIGTELVMGRIQDTNAHWMAQEIAKVGGYLRRATMLPDDLDEIVLALREAIDRGTKILITTGGLGPTPDDLTVEAVARLTGVKPVADEFTLQDFMRRRNLTDRAQVTPGMVKMATVPEGSEVLQNPAGWAPCARLRIGGATLMILPGPPKEMVALFSRYVEGFISESYQTKIASVRVVVSMFESEVSPLLQEVMERHPNTYLKAYVALRHEGHGMPVDIVARGEDPAAAQQLLDRALDLLGRLVTEKGKTMEYFEGAS